MNNMNNRRTFLKQSLTASTAIAGVPLALIGAQPAAAASASQEPLKVSILSYSFRGQLQAGTMDVFGYLETCKYRYGLGAADIWTSPKGFLASLEDDYLKKVRRALDERELTLASLTVDFAEIWDNDPEKRRVFYENAMANLKAAGILGARFVRIDAGGDRKTGVWTDEQFDHIVKRYKEYVQYASDHGFKVGAENHWGPEGVWANMQKLRKAVDHPAFGFTCHLGGWQGTEEERAVADRECAPYVCHTHIPWNITESPVLVEKLGNLWKAGYSGYYSVEHHSAREEYTEVAVQLAKVFAVLRSFQEGGTGGSLSATPRRGRPAGAAKP